LACRNGYFENLVVAGANRVADEAENPPLRFFGDLSVWAGELPEAARLELNDDGRTVEMYGVSLEKRHELKLLAQRAGIDNAHAIEALLYLWLYKSVGKPGASEGSSRYFHARRSERTVYHGSTKFEGNQIVGYFYPLRNAVLEYCGKLPQGVGNEASTTPGCANLTAPNRPWARSHATQNQGAQGHGTAQNESAQRRPMATEERRPPGQERDDVARARGRIVAHQPPVDPGRADLAKPEVQSGVFEARRHGKTPSERLTEYKVSNKLRTHDLVAEKLGLERSVYFELKAGRKVSEETYIKAAHGLGCSVDDLKD
jgi:hypothetical protein